MDAPAPLEQAREQAVRRLCDAFAEDRLSAELLEERLDRAARAAAPDELRALLADLPPAPAAALAPPARERQVIPCIMSGMEKRGAWTPARRTVVVAVMGGAVLDFREARLRPGVTEVTALVVMGEVNVIVAPGVRVELGGSAVLGAVSQLSQAPPPDDPLAPVLRISGVVLMASMDVDVRRPDESAPEARRREKRERIERIRLDGG